MISRGVMDGSEHAPLVRVHAHEMAMAASQVAEELADQEIPSDLAANVNRTKDLARRASEALDRLSQHPDDPETAGSVAAELQADRGQLGSLLAGSQ